MLSDKEVGALWQKLHGARTNIIEIIDGATAVIIKLIDERKVKYANTLRAIKPKP